MKETENLDRDILCSLVDSMYDELLNLIIDCGHCPAAFGQRYTVTIPKLTDCCTESMSVEDFRRIAINLVI